MIALRPLAILALLCATPAFAQSPDEAAEQQARLDALPWKTSGKGQLGPNAEIAIPPDMRYLPAAETSKLLEKMGNLTDHSELGLMGPRDLSWFVVFFFDDVGFVKDDDKDQLDANKMADTMKEHMTSANETRRERHLEEMFFDGWAIPPRYNATTQQLEWATRLRSTSGTNVNYNTRVLGRKGVMRAIVVTDPELLDATLPKFQSMMNSFSFIRGEDYASYRVGDKIAEYGLVALVAGGAGAIAAKTGLLSALVIFVKKGAKLIIAGVAAGAAAIKKLFAKKEGPATR